MIKRLFFLGLITCILGLSFLIAVPLTPQGFVVSVPQGASVRTVARTVANNSFAPAWLLEGIGRLMNVAGQLKAGQYNLSQSQTAFSFWSALIEQAPEMIEVQLLEGWTFKQIRQAINQTNNLKHETLMLDNVTLMQRLGAGNLHPEGRFFPDTYQVSIGSTDLFVYKAAFERMRKLSKSIWQTRPLNSPLNNSDELINLAAIIEKETGLNSDRGNVASVFHNRLKIGMRLQTDPSIIYGMGDSYQGKIYKINLLTDTPYNTYIHTGLPPTPIAAPSEASLRAAMNPPATDFLYFVAKADKTGGSQFSITLEQHNRAVAEYWAHNRTQ